MSLGGARTILAQRGLLGVGAGGGGEEGTIPECRDQAQMKWPLSASPDGPLAPASTDLSFSHKSLSGCLVPMLC